MNLDFIAYPLGALLKMIFNVTNNYGYSLILFTILIKVILLPINIKQTQSTKKMNELQPKIKELQTKYKGDSQKMNEKMMEFYKENNYNPASGCLPALIQMPILFSLFYVIQNPVKFVFKSQAVFDSITKSFLWLTDLGKAESAATLIHVLGYGLPILAILSGVTTYFQMKMIAPKGNTVDPTQKSMTTIMPIMFAWITLKVPAGLAIYWVVGNLFTIAQQYFMMKNLPAGKEVK